MNTIRKTITIEIQEHFGKEGTTTGIDILLTNDCDTIPEVIGYLEMAKSQVLLSSGGKIEKIV